jgi:hypothetical protein
MAPLHHAREALQLPHARHRFESLLDRLKANPKQFDGQWLNARIRHFSREPPELVSVLLW